MLFSKWKVGQSRVQNRPEKYSKKFGPVRNRKNRLRTHHYFKINGTSSFLYFKMYALSKSLVSVANSLFKFCFLKYSLLNLKHLNSTKTFCWLLEIKCCVIRRTDFGAHCYYLLFKKKSRLKLCSSWFSVVVCFALKSVIFWKIFDLLKIEIWFIITLFHYNYK